MSGEARIRSMTPADIDAAHSLASTLDQAPHWPAAAYLVALDPGATPPRLALVAETGQELQGFAIASVLPPDAELESIVVAARHQRTGIAKRLFTALSGELRTWGVSQILLEVRASNQPARAFYQDLGFEESGRRLRYYIDPTEDAILMRYRVE